MSEVHSTTDPTPENTPSRKRAKPEKPFPEFPLQAHGSGQWAKRIRGRLHYFGKWADPDAAIALWNREKDDLYAGRDPRPREGDSPQNVKSLCNAFLAFKKGLVDGGELSPRTLADYSDACRAAILAFGASRTLTDLRPSDFESLRRRFGKYSLTRQAKLVTCVRSVFLYAYEAEIIDRPIRFGPGFKVASAAAMRKAKAKAGARLFTPREILAMADGALVVGQEGPELVKVDAQLRAMVLLGINAGLGNSDCGHLPGSALDLDTGWLDFPRPKTAMPRRAWLWPETTEAIRQTLAIRPAPKDAADAGLIFITKYGHSWAKDSNDNPISKEFRKLLDRLGLNGHRGFYCLRHSHRTASDMAKDQPAADLIMGHVAPHMSSHYRERIDDARIKAVCQSVREWLYGEEVAK